MELTINVNPIERTVRLREVHALAAGDSCSVVLDGVRGADVSSLRLALYRDAASDSPVASCPSFSPVRGHPNLATGDLRLDTTEMAAWFEAVRPEPEGSGSGDAAERAVRADGWMVVSEPTRTWAACRVPVILRPGAGVSGAVDPTSIQSLVEGLVSASVSEALASKADKATTLAGYGITDAATKTELDAVDQRAANAIFGVESDLSTKADKSALENHEGDTNNPHKVTAAQVGAVPLIEDVDGEKTAVTIGGRSSIGTVGKYSLANGQFVNASGYNSHAEGEGTTASGQFSHSEGQGTTASGYYSHAEGYGTISSGHFSHADGYESQTSEGHQYSFAWNGDTSVINRYTSHGPGTFNINPVGGTDGFYIGDQTLSAIIFGSVTNNISADNPTFSNAVLAVGLNIDTNSVAVLNEIASTSGGFPIEGTATTVGGLLAALAAAVAWLKKNKVQTLKLNDGSVETSADGGVAKLDDFFTESNSLLTATIDARLPYPLNAVIDETELLKDRALNTTSLASVTVPDNFTDLLIRASVSSSLSVTMPESITTKYGDTFPGEAGEYLITITKTGTSEAYVRTIKLEVANA